MLLDRRDFLKLSAIAGGGVLLSINSACAGGERPYTQPQSGALQAGPFLAFFPDGRIEVSVPKPDLGQGIRTALMMLVAEELNLDPAAITVRQAPLDSIYGDQQTSSSYGVIGTWPQMRTASAAARDMFLKAAAKRWHIKTKDCTLKQAAVFQPDGNTHLTFVQLMEKPEDLRLSAKPSLKTTDRFKVIGTNVPDVDLHAAVTGTKRFGMDHRSDNLVFAAVARCPWPGGAVARVDDRAATKAPGVIKIVQIQGSLHPTHVRAGVAVVANSTWRAKKALELLDVQWTPPENLTQSIDQLRSQAVAKLNAKGIPLLETGSKPVLENPSLDLIYETPFLAHAPMEPLNCTAHVTNGYCELHAPTQAPAWTAEAVARALDMPKEKVRVEVALMGGGFGRRVNPDTAVEAALIAREIKGPVMVVWSREDDIRGGFYRPFNMHRIQIDLSESGPAAWRHHMAVTPLAVTYNGSDVADPHQPELHGGTHDMPYHFDYRRLEFSQLDTHLTTGWWRGVSYSYNIFAVESAIDELAAALSKDPLQLRLDLLARAEAKGPKGGAVNIRRLTNVLKQVAQLSSWSQTSPNMGKGLACCWYHSAKAYVAQVIEVEKTAQGIHIHKVWTASDNGLVINPDRVHAQVEGAVIYGLGAAMTGRIQLDQGKVVEGNFDTYIVPRIHQIPKMETQLVGGSLKPGGAGEPGLPAVAPALTNALFAATGKRYRRLPLQLDFV